MAAPQAERQRSIVPATVHPLRLITTSAPPLAKLYSLPPHPSLTPPQLARLNQLIGRFLALATKSAFAADTALEMGDWVLRNLGA